MAKIIQKIDILATLKTFKPGDNPIFLDYETYCVTDTVLRSSIYQAKIRGHIDKDSSWKTNKRVLPVPGVEFMRLT